MANPKQAAWYGNNYGWLLPIDCGTVFYVDGYNGSNANDGLTDVTPVLTITYALSLCTDAAGQNDVILVLRYPSAGAAGETWPIAVDVESVHILGMNLATQGEPGTPRQVCILNPTGDHPAMLISKNSVEIAGFEMGGGAAHGCIENSGTVWRTHIHHNDFGWIYTCQDGIKMTGLVDCPHWLVERNRFGTNIARDGIRIEHNSTRSFFMENIFRHPGTRCFHAQGLCTDIGGVLDNDFKVPDATNGEAIYFENTNAAGAMVIGNRVASGTAAMTFNPYRDLGAGNHWGLNHAGLTPTYPITV